MVILAKKKRVIKTWLEIAISEGTYTRIAPCSRIALERFIEVSSGVVDAHSRGEGGVVLFNHTEDNFRVNKVDRIEQLILKKIATPTVDKSPDTRRHVEGFRLVLEALGSNLVEQGMMKSLPKSIQ